MAGLEREKGFYERRLAKIQRQEEYMIRMSKAAEVSKRTLRPLKETYKKYRNRVWALTKQQPLSTLPGFEKRAFNEFILNHKVSTRDGYKNNLPAEWIADFSNLRIIPMPDRRSRADPSDKDALVVMLERKAKLSQAT